MKIQPFQLERYFARYEFSAPYLLSSSDCEPFTLSELLALADPQSCALWERLSLGYTESQGLPLLRQEVTQLYRRIQPEEVLIITPEEGIFLAMNALLEAGDHVVATYPGYQSLYQVARDLGCQVSEWTPRQEEEGWRFRVEDLRAAVHGDIRLIVVNFPHNPTGALPSRREFEEILEVARERGAAVFSDEMYRYLEYDPKDRLDSASDLYENAISLSGMSKAFALAGLRIGWLTTRNQGWMERLAVSRDYTTICSSAPSEVLALIGLRARGAILSRNLGIIQANLVRLEAFFAGHWEWFAWHRPRAGSVAFPSLRSAQRVENFCLDLVGKKGVLLVPSTIFGFPGNGFRVGFGRRNLPEALAQLEAYLAERGS